MELLISPKKFGGDLIAAVADKRKKDFSEAVVKEVNHIVERRQLMQRELDKAKKRLELCDAQLAAINAGDFTIEPYRTYVPAMPSGRDDVLHIPYRGMIRYNDIELCVDWSETEKW